jgi:membrane-associated phospholipid phosphatase
MQDKIFRFISKALSPLLSFSYCLIATILQNGDIMAVKAGLVIFLQVICFAYVLGKLFTPKADYLLETHSINERIFLYSACIIGLLLSKLWLNLLNIKGYEVLLITGSIFLSLTLVITIFWKISAHTTVFSGGAMIFVDSHTDILFWVFLLVSFLLGYIRVYLKAHTPMQVIAGIMLGTATSFAVRYYLN